MLRRAGFSSLAPLVSLAPFPHGCRCLHSRTAAVNWGIRVVPEKTACVIERLGRYRKTLLAGFHLLIPLIDRVAYIHSLKEEAIPIPNQQAITKDNVAINVDGVLYIRVVDPCRASYGVEDPLYAITQLAQTTMRSELGKLTLDKTFEEREVLNEAIVKTINQASEAWGIESMRYEIRDIVPPKSVKEAMDKQAEAERRKRAHILESEGEMQAQINAAESGKRSTVLASEAARTEQLNQAEGEAGAILAKARAVANGIEAIATAIRKPRARDAVALRLAEHYIAAFGKIAQHGNTILLPANTGDVGSMVTQALAVFQTLTGRKEEDNKPPRGRATQPDTETTEQLLWDPSDPDNMDKLEGPTNPTRPPTTGVVDDLLRGFVTRK